jgi:peptide/nickel transport system substrate-binding protein
MMDVTAQRRPLRPLVLSMVMLLILVACTADDSTDTTQSSDGATSTVATTTPGGDTTTPGGDGGAGDDTLVPPIRFLGPTAAYEEALFESNNIMLENWAALGLTVEPTLLGDVGEIIDNAAPREYEALSFGYGGRVDRIDPNELISRPFKCEFAGPNGSNYSDYCNPAYDELVDAQKSAIDVAEREELIDQAQELQALDLPWLTVYHNWEVFAYNNEAYSNVAASVVVGASTFQNYMEAEPLTDDQVFRFGSDSVWRTINPTAVESYNQEVEVQKLVFDTLTKIQPDGTVGPHLAESWEFPDDTTLVVDLVNPATFTDGEPLTAEDVKFSYDYFKEWDVGLYIDALSEIESVEVIDDETVQFNLVQPSATVLFNALTNIMILPQHIWETIVEDEGLSHPSEWTVTNPVGSGPFIVDTIVGGEAVELTRNDDYWTTPSNSAAVQAIFFGDSQGLFRALQDGTIYFHQHGALAPDARQQVTEGAFPHLTSGTVGSVETRGVAFRMSEGSPFRDYYFRMAMANTVDKDFAVDVGNRGFADKGAGTISPGNVVWFNDAIPSENGELGTPYWPQLDLDRARQILSDAGYTWDDEGRLHYPSANYVPEKVLASD